jgi:hypothetical protein
MSGKKGQKQFNPPTEFLIAAEVRRLEKQDQCPHGDISGPYDGVWVCVCGKAFTEIELDEFEWDLEEKATTTSDR